MMTSEQPNRNIVFCPPCLDSRALGKATAPAAKSKVEKIMATRFLDVSRKNAKEGVSCVPVQEQLVSKLSGARRLSHGMLLPQCPTRMYMFSRYIG